MAHYVHDENHNRILAYSAEEVLSVLAQAIEDGDLDNITADAAFITRLKSILDGKTYFVAFLTQSEYNALVQADELEENTIYYITDDSTLDDLQTAFATFQERASADILQLQSNFQNLVGLLGSPVPIYNDKPYVGPYAWVQSTGLYAVDIYVPITGGGFYISVLISIDDFNKEIRSGIIIDGVSIEIEFNANDGIHLIDYSALGPYISSCRLVVPYFINS